MQKQPATTKILGCGAMVRTPTKHDNLTSFCKTVHNAMLLVLEVYEVTLTISPRARLAWA